MNHPLLGSPIYGTPVSMKMLTKHLRSSQEVAQLRMEDGYVASVPKAIRQIGEQNLENAWFLRIFTELEREKMGFT